MRLTILRRFSAPWLLTFLAGAPLLHSIGPAEAQRAASEAGQGELVPLDPAGAIDSDARATGEIPAVTTPAPESVGSSSSAAAPSPGRPQRPIMALVDFETS